ncbi:glycosyltransferase family 2 protein [Phaeobacter porticola]|uniref:Glycosyl transferase family 2 n=1 Tax=Phaeobacter porticola TaxID=1844006 RepID=A0A1L3I2X7_9RHOB|nr:glycosyltransferase family 2 protein [Phaeobacter porticola]APG46459.1 Glycosyl transferase family 2 [Phaeobacter porticola]
MISSHVKRDTWGVVATIKAEATAILAFAAHHLERGAHRLYLYLDTPCPEAWPHLKAHPKIRPTLCDASYWARAKHGRPQKHQPRQTHNATRCYRNQAHGEVDWLIHMDVDEFLWAQTAIGAQLAALPTDAICARVRPLEALAGSEDAYKAPVPQHADSDGALQRLYPSYGQDLRGGFLSHVQGKQFLRCGPAPFELRIHNAYLADIENPGRVELSATDLCHRHCQDWSHWLAQYRYRLERGSYRAALKPHRPRANGGRNLHEVLSEIEEKDGLAGLRAFFDTVCADSPLLRDRLQAEGLLRVREFDLAGVTAKHFPHFTRIGDHLGADRV